MFSESEMGDGTGTWQVGSDREITGLLFTGRVRTLGEMAGMLSPVSASSQDPEASIGQRPGRHGSHLPLLAHNETQPGSPWTHTHPAGRVGSGGQVAGSRAGGRGEFSLRGCLSSRRFFFFRLMSVFKPQTLCW